MTPAPMTSNATEARVANFFREVPIRLSLICFFVFIFKLGFVVGLFVFFRRGKLLIRGSKRFALHESSLFGGLCSLRAKAKMRRVRSTNWTDDQCFRATKFRKNPAKTNSENLAERVVRLTRRCRNVTGTLRFAAFQKA
jgi:hypothetical protein